MNLQLTGGLQNEGSIAAGQQAAVLAQSIDNTGGLISGDTLDLTALRDISSHGGDIRARRELSLRAGRDITGITDTRRADSEDAHSRHERTSRDRTAGFYAQGDGWLALVAGRDIRLRAAELKSAGSLTLTAGRGLELNSITTARRDNLDENSSSRHEYQSQDEGTQFAAGTDLTLTAGRSIQSRAAAH